MAQNTAPAQPDPPCGACHGSGQLPPVLIENLAAGSKTMVPQPCLACTPR